MKTTHTVTAQGAFCKHCLLLVFITALSTSAVHAQHTSHERIDRIKDKVQYQGYTIYPIVASDGSLGYDIQKGNKLLVHQYHPPAMDVRLYKKEDAYKVAQWTIQQYAKTGHFPTAVPPAAIKDLHLSSTTPH